MVQDDATHIPTDGPENAVRVTIHLKHSREDLRGLAEAHSELLDDVERAAVRLVGRDAFDFARRFWSAIADGCDGNGTTDDEPCTVDDVDGFALGAT